MGVSAMILTADLEMTLITSAALGVDRSDDPSDSSDSLIPIFLVLNVFYSDGTFSSFLMFVDL